MRIAVCDDSITEQEQVVRALYACDAKEVPECFTSGKDLLTAAEKTPLFDLAFLDIYMPGENGVEIAQSLLAKSPSTEIVFVTTSMDHAVDAFSLNAIHYLVKPVTEEKVAEALERMKRLREKKRPMLVLSTGNGSRNLFLDEISYIQCMGHAKDIVLISGRTVRVWVPLEKLEPKLGGAFLKLNRSVIVNMEQIEQMNVDDCMLRDGTTLEFARRERAAIRAAYDSYLFARLGGGGRDVS